MNNRSRNLTIRILGTTALFLSAFCVNDAKSYGDVASFQGAKSAGLAGGGAALPMDATSGNQNPALMGHVGNIISLHGGAAFEHHTADYLINSIPALGITNVRAAGPQKSHPSVVPLTFGGFNKVLSEKASWGFSLTGFGNIVRYNNNFVIPSNAAAPAVLAFVPGSGAGNTFLHYTVTQANNTLAYKTSDRQTLAVDFIVGYKRMHTNVRLANGTWNNSQGKADGALGLGLKLGGLWKLTNNLDLGAAIGTPVAYEKFKRYDNLFPLRSNEAWNGTIGLAYKIMPSTTITLDVEGELLHRAKFYGASPAIGGSGLKNAYNYEFGIQHTFNPCLTGRVGYNYGPTPIGNNIVHNSVFDDAVVLTEHMVGTGLTYSLNKKIDLDFALNYFFKKTLTDDGSLTAGASNGLRLSGRVLSLMFGFNYKY